MGDALVQRVLQRAGVPHVRLVRDDPPVERLDLLDGFGEVLLGGARVGGHRLDRPGDVDRDDVGPLLGQPDRVAAALAAGGTGDEGDLACYTSCHVSSFAGYVTMLP